MPDGQHAFGFRALPVSQLRAGEIIVDLFAGGGGASTALRQALGRDPDIAINHDAWAVGMHAANHPFARHLCEDVWAADPRSECAGRAVGWLHASPDCTHFSQAKGGQPRSRATRALSWVVLKWAGAVRPRIISLENVEQIQKWGPLVAKRDRDTGRVVTLDGSIAERGERVPVEQQFLIPDKRHAGRTWRHFVAALRALGYVVEWKRLCALDFGADTDRRRLYMVARCDGEPIRWPAPTHGTHTGAARPGCTANSIDWSVLGRSIFDRARPLRPNTIRRLLNGAERAAWPEPYLDALIALRDGRKPNLRVTPQQAEEIAIRFGHHAGLIMATGGGGIARPVSMAAPTITSGGHGAAPHFIRPVIVHKYNSAGGRGARSVDEAMPTSTGRGAGYLAEPIIAPYYGSGSGTSGQPCSRSMPTVTAKARFALAEPIIISTCNSSSVGVRMATDATRTITTARGGDMALAEPIVTEYAIDILYRMLFERELFNAQGFPRNYVIDRTADGRRISRARAVRMVGNSVSPPPLAALARANLDPVSVSERIAA